MTNEAIYIKMSCLFDSLSHFTTGIDSQKLRSITCYYLKTNPSLFDDIHTNDIINWTYGLSIQEYIKNMENPNTWGSGIEIKAFCEIFNVSVVVLCMINKKNIEFIPKSGNKSRVLRITWDDNHYTPIR